jgi:hypothetical protein
MAEHEGGMPTPDMTRPPGQAERPLSHAERQKLEVFRKEHPDEEGAQPSGPGKEMPNPRMTE